MNWCMHMDQYQDCSGDLKTQINSWIYCPLCGAKRPERPKNLVEKFEVVLANNHGVYGSAALWRAGIKNALADAALEYFEQVVDKTLNFNDWTTAKKFKHILKEAMREALEAK